MVPLHARSARLASMRHYIRDRRKEKERRARRLLANVEQHRLRLVVFFGAVALCLLELGFVLGVAIERGRG